MSVNRVGIGFAALNEKVESHQFFMRGWFHCFALLSGKIHAFVEDERGGVGTYDMSYHSITFLDPKPVPEEKR